MQEFILQIATISYWTWVIVFLIRWGLNHYIYLRLGNEDVEDTTYLVYNEPDKQINAYVLELFTFWWQEHTTEKDPYTRKCMKISNLSNILIILLTIWVCFVFLYNYSHRSMI